jgi:hypothetical protein
MGVLVFFLENGYKPLDHPVVMTSSPVNPTTFAALGKSVVPLPDIGGYPAPHRFPIHLKDNRIAHQATTERVNVARREVQLAHHLKHLLNGFVIPDEYQGTVFKPPFQPHGTGQDDARIVNRTKKIPMPTFVLAQRIEAGRTQIPAQFAEGRISRKSQGRPHDGGRAGTNNF